MEREGRVSLEVLHRDTLPLGGFAGLTEHRLVTDPRAFGAHGAPRTWSGIGNFVYLADARFLPHGETRLHPHREIDVISVIVDGRITHEGSLEHGQELKAFDVQVQRAGGEGFAHNEVNPDPVPNRMLQLWVLPEVPGEPAGYKVYRLEWGKGLHRIYGGPASQTETFPSQTVIEVGLLRAGQPAAVSGPFLAYLSQGSGTANGITVADGDLFRGPSLNFAALEDVQLTVVHTVL